MYFDNPSFLWFFPLSLLPLVFHLINFRRQKKVYFSNITFIKQIKSLNQKQRNIIEYLLLGLRILLLVFLILAFAKPKFGSSNSSLKENAISIYLDNSSSMMLQQNGLSLFQLAKQKTLDIINAANDEDKFHIQNNINDNKKWTWQTKKEASEFVKSLEEFGPYETTYEVIQNAEEMFDDVKNYNHILYLVSDFQKSNFPDTKEILSLKNVKVNIIACTQLNEKNENIYFQEAHLKNGLRVAQVNTISYTLLRNKAKDEQSTTLKLFVDGQLKLTQNSDFKVAQDTLTDSLQFSTSNKSWNEIMLIIDDNGLPIDDTFRIAAKAEDKQKVLMLSENGGNPYIQACFKPEPNIVFQNSSTKNLSTINSENYNLIIIDQLKNFTSEIETKLISAINKGSSLIIFPSKDLDISSYNNFLQKAAYINISNADTSYLQINSLQSQHELWQGVFEKIPQNLELPTVRFHYPIKVIGGGIVENLMSFSNGSAFLSAAKNNDKYIVFCSSPSDLSSSDFVKSYYLLPLLYRMSQTAGVKTEFDFTNDEVIKINVSELISNSQTQEIYKLKLGTKEVIAEAQNNVQGNYVIYPKALPYCGFWKLYDANENSLDVLLAVNFGAKESDLQYLKESDLKKIFGSINYKFIENRTIHSSDNENTFPTWKILVILGLILIIIESILLRKK